MWSLKVQERKNKTVPKRKRQGENQSMNLRLNISPEWA